MGAITSQITGVSIVYSTVCPGADQRNIKAPRHWPSWGEFTGDQWKPRTEGQWRGKFFHLMTSSWFVHAISLTYLCRRRPAMTRRATSDIWVPQVVPASEESTPPSLWTWIPHWLPGWSVPWPGPDCPPSRRNGSRISQYQLLTIMEHSAII